MEYFNFSRWKLLMQQWQLAEHGPLFDMLQAMYQKESRYYHSTQHVDACLKHLQHYRAELQHPEEVELALWFHDAVCDPFRQDNELKSAQWAQAFLQSQHVDAAKTERVHQLIIATCHGAAHSEPLSKDQCWMLDFDLAVLGADAASYRAYEHAIRDEYREVPLPLYCQKRSELLQGFLAAETLYLTEAFRQEREAQARRNLSWAVESLSAGRIPE